LIIEVFELDNSGNPSGEEARLRGKECKHPWLNFAETSQRIIPDILETFHSKLAHFEP
jgi:hypothetical protein